jgi:hypothetical protein
MTTVRGHAALHGYSTPANTNGDSSHWDVGIATAVGESCKAIIDLAEPLIEACADSATEIRAAVTHQIEVFYYG